MTVVCVYASTCVTDTYLLSTLYRLQNCTLDLSHIYADKLLYIMCIQTCGWLCEYVWYHNTCHLSFICVVSCHSKLVPCLHLIAIITHWGKHEQIPHWSKLCPQRSIYVSVYIMYLCVLRLSINIYFRVLFQWTALILHLHHSIPQIPSFSNNKMASICMCCILLLHLYSTVHSDGVCEWQWCAFSHASAEHWGRY